VSTLSFLINFKEKRKQPVSPLRQNSLDKKVYRQKRSLSTEGFILKRPFKKAANVSMLVNCSLERLRLVLVMV